MAKPDTANTATAAEKATTANAPAQVLPPVPGGGSWRPNAAGDGWVENLPEPATPASEPT